MSSISSIALLNTFAVKDLGALQEKTVQLGYKEVRLTNCPLLALLFFFSRLHCFLLRFVSSNFYARFAGSGDSQGLAAVQDRAH
jgi:hypothetical protein